MTIKWVKVDPLVMNGEPFCYGSRLTVRQLLELRSNGFDLTRLTKDHPELKRVGIAAAYTYAAQHRDRFADFFEADGSLAGPGYSESEAAGARLSVDVDPAIPELELDPVRIHQVLSNLVDNAIRYTPRDGHVRIVARRRGGEVEIGVTDDGPGLSAELRDTLFDRFVKSPDSPGSGLGLAIAKAIVEAHGGRIHAVAGEHGGTTILLSIPLVAAP